MRDLSVQPKNISLIRKTERIAAQLTSTHHTDLFFLSTCHPSHKNSRWPLLVVNMLPETSVVQYINILFSVPHLSFFFSFRLKHAQTPQNRPTATAKPDSPSCCLTTLRFRKPRSCSMTLNKRESDCFRTLIRVSVF